MPSMNTYRIKEAALKKRRAEPPSASSRPTCLWCHKVHVHAHGGVCGWCLDERVRQLNRAVRLLLPAEGETLGRDGEEAIRPLLAERRRAMLMMDKETRQFWREENAKMPLPRTFG